MNLPQNLTNDNYLQHRILNDFEDQIEEINLVDTLNDHSEKLRFRNQDFVKSLEYGQKAKKIAQDINYEKGLAWALLNIGSCLIYSDLSNEPYKYLNESLDIFRRLNDSVGEAHVLLILGKANLTDEKYVSAYYKIEQGLNLSIFSNYQNGEILAYYIFALLSEKLEDYESTVKYCKLALTTSASFDLKSRILVIIGTNLIAMGKTSQAKHYLKEALEESELINDKFSQSHIYIQLGKIFLREGQTEKAKENLKNGLQLANEIGLFDNSRVVLDDITESYIEFQDYESALDILKEFQKTVDINKNPHRLAIVLMKIASIKIKMNNTEKSAKLLEQIWEIAKDGENNKLRYECQKAFAEVFEMKKEYQKSLEHYKLFHSYKIDFDNIGTANKTKILADRMDIENERKLKQLEKEKNSEVAQMVYEVYENIDKLQKAKDVISLLQNENEKLQNKNICPNCQNSRLDHY